MATTDTQINSTNAKNDATNTLRTQIVNTIVWNKNNAPNGDGNVANQLDDASTIPTFTSSNISTDKVVTASYVINELSNFLVNLTRIRYLRFYQTYNDNGNNVVQFDQTKISIFKANPDNMSGTYSRNVANPLTQSFTTPSSSVTTNERADASDFNNYLTALYNTWNTLKNNTVTITNSLCHSSCHSSHGNRGRR